LRPHHSGRRRDGVVESDLGERGRFVILFVATPGILNPGFPGDEHASKIRFQLAFLNRFDILFNNAVCLKAMPEGTATNHH
jgi:hypothetical protein